LERRVTDVRLITQCRRRKIGRRAAAEEHCFSRGAVLLADLQRRKKLVNFGVHAILSFQIVCDMTGCFMTNLRWGNQDA
jgi:hypothetical protein